MSRESGGAQPGMKHAKGKGPTQFSKMDLMALVITDKLRTPAACIAYVQSHGSVGAQAFVSKHQRRLQEYVDDAVEWDRAQEVAAAERRSDWELIQHLSKKTCRCGQRCQWWEAADDFFIRNSATIDRQELAACLARVICDGPSKTCRVPLVIGTTNSAKGTVLNPIVQVFGFSNVVHRPGEKASMALANITKKSKRFIFWDEYRPVEYAARGTVPVGTFLSLFGNASLEIQVSQSFQNGNAEIHWKHGAAMTAKEEGLWDLITPLPGLVPVTEEDIKHMQSRVHQFNAAAALQTGALLTVPACKGTFCRWLVIDAALFAVGAVQRPICCLQGWAPPELPEESIEGQMRVDYF